MPQKYFKSQIPNKPHILLSAPSGQEQQQFKNINNPIQSLLNNFDNGRKQVSPEDINRCQFQFTCEPDSYRREVFNLLEHRRYLESFAPDEVKREFDRFYLNPNFNEAIRNKDFPPRGRPVPGEGCDICRKYWYERGHGRLLNP